MTRALALPAPLRPGFAGALRLARAGMAGLAVLFVVLGASLAGAEPLPVLIEERARDSAGPAMPERGRFEITILPGAPETAVLVSAWWMDPATGRFIANVVTERGDVRRVNGMATLIVPVPIPLRRLMPGDIIGESDLGSIDLPAARLGAFTVTDPAALSGMQVRSLLAEGRPVMVQSVMEPLVVGRGDLVTIRHSDGALQLTAPGRALGDAHRGQEVRIVNLISNSTVSGVARADGSVEVRR